MVLVFCEGFHRKNCGLFGLVIQWPLFWATETSPDFFGECLCCFFARQIPFAKPPFVSVSLQLFWSITENLRLLWMWMVFHSSILSSIAETLNTWYLFLEFLLKSSGPTWIIRGLISFRRFLNHYLQSPCLELPSQTQPCSPNLHFNEHIQAIQKK